VREVETKSRKTPDHPDRSLPVLLLLYTHSSNRVSSPLTMMSFFTRLA
jgi:hypothetical protein